MKKIIIVGAGRYGREVYSLINAINRIQLIYNCLGFIDDNLNALDGIRCDGRIICSIKDWEHKDDIVYAMGIASPKGKEKLSTLLKERGATFETLIHPTARICEYIDFGEGCIVSGGSSIGSNSKIGNFVNIAGSMVGQDTIIGDFSFTGGFANITIARIGKRVFIGSHAFIINDRVIGDDAFVCVGSIVLSNVKPGIKVMGYPARKVDF